MTNIKKDFLEKDKLIKEISLSKNNELIYFFNNKKIGLTNLEANQYIEKNGFNELKKNKKNFLAKLIEGIISPFNLLLLIIVVFEFLQFFILNNDDKLSYLISGILVFCMVILSITVEMILNYKSEKTHEELIKLIKNKIHVIRNYNYKHEITKYHYSKIIKNIKIIETKNVALGDLVHISSGDVIPANIRIIYSQHLMVDQSSISGETIPVEKKNLSSNKENNIDLKNICFSGSTVTSGFGIGIVFQRINDTFLGLLNNKELEKEKITTFKKGIKDVTKIIIFMIVFSVIIIFLSIGLKNYFLKNNDLSVWLEALVFAISVSVGLIPESLPVILSANLARGSKNMAKKKMLIKSLDSVQNIGSIDILCTDKTGTLTNNNIQLDSYYDLSFKKNNEILNLAVLNSYFQTSLVNNTIDNAIINEFENNNNKQQIEKFIKIDEIPFSFDRRILSVITKCKKHNYSKIISKGAFEEIIKLCNNYEKDGKIKVITKEFQKKIKDIVQNLNNKGMRVVALAYKKTNEKDIYNHEDEQNMTLIGLMSFLDKPKKDANEIIKIIEKYGINLKIISGDNEKVTKTICSKLNFNISSIITSKELKKYKGDDLIEKINHANVFVKISPIQKAEIVSILQKKHKVGFMGDGINDALALKQSDASISVNNASEIAKESSDFILMEKNLKIVENGIIQGRIIFGNIIKYIKITLANKFSLLLTFVISSLWLNFQLMSPFQILFLDLLFDFTQMAVIFDRVDSEFIQKPKKWEVKGWYKFAIINGIIMSLFSFINFAIVGYGFINMQNGIPNQTKINEFHTSVFIQIGLIYILGIFVLRTKEWMFFEKNNKPPLPMWTIILGILLFIITLPSFLSTLNIADELQFAQINNIWYLILICYGIGYYLLQGMVKKIYIKIFNDWI